MSVSITSNTFIYCIRCPISNEIRYVGKTTRGIRRKYEHNSKTKQNPKTHLARWLKKLIDCGNKPIFEVIEYVDNIEKLNYREIYWIDIYRSKSDLCNIIKWW